MENLKRYPTQSGHRFPFGATFDSQGTNFSVWGRFATRVELLLYERSDSPTPFQVIDLDSEVNKTFYAWHVYVEGLATGTCYGWRMDGPGDTRTTGRKCRCRPFQAGCGTLPSIRHNLHQEISLNRRNSPG